MSRQFQGIIQNNWESPIIHQSAELSHGDWQAPFFPDDQTGAGNIRPGGVGEWRSESNFGTGTSGQARWAVRVLDIADGDFGPDGLGHFEFLQVNWQIPLIQTQEPTLTCSISRHNPEESDGFALPKNPNPPVLEFVIESVNGIHVTDLDEMVGYVLIIPASWFLNNFILGQVSLARVNYLLRRRPGSNKSTLTFPNSLPTRQQLAMEAFHNRMSLAGANGFAAAFPNFRDSHVGLDHFGGTTFLTSAAVEWRDVPLAELENVPLNDFASRMRAANKYAVKHGFLGALPTYFHANKGHGIVCGLFLIKPGSATLRKVRPAELGNTTTDNFEVLFRAVDDYAKNLFFAGGFPTLLSETSQGISLNSPHGHTVTIVEYSIVLFKPGVAVSRDVLLFRDPA